METDSIDLSEYRSVSVAIVMEVAAKLGVDPITLPPLADRIETDALDEFFRTGSNIHPPTRGTPRLEFEYVGQHITVEGTRVKIVESNNGHVRASSPDV